MSLTTTGPSRSGDALDRRRIALSGALDFAVAEMTRNQIADILASSTITELVIDLGVLDFLDAAGIGALVTCYQEADRVGKACRLTAAHGSVLRVLDLTGVGALLSKSPPPGRQG